MAMLCTRAMKRKMPAGVAAAETLPVSSNVNLLSPTHLLLEIPADGNTSLPVWDAMSSQQVDIAWTIDPYSVSVHLTPATSKQGRRSGESDRVPSGMLTSPLTGQQHGASQNTSSVLLPSSQNPQSPPNPPQKTPPTTSSVSVVSRPSIPTTNRSVLPKIQSTPNQLLTRSKVATPSLFHTNISADVPICDKFLFNLCHAGKKCQMHHTPYPFHWQLWCVATRQWVDVSPRSQPLLEKIYSDVNQEWIDLRDGPVRYSLNFDSMKLDNPSKYDKVRRLTNSDSPVTNPHFPSKYRIYWWNNLIWKEYDEDVSACLLQTMSERKLEAFFYMGQQKYKVDFTTMTQTNVTTGFYRKVRCRPVYRSPESMHPYLQTGVQPDPTQCVATPLGANFSVDPLEEFSSWYPPVWCPASEQDYSLVDVPPGTRAYLTIHNLFNESMSVHGENVDIISIQQVQNRLHWDKYQRHKVYMQKKHATSKEPLERHLFHGTNKKASRDICYNNFDPRLAGVNGASLGFGTYFATTASFSHGFSMETSGNEVYHMFLAKVLVGKVSVGRSSYRRPPQLRSVATPRRFYDACVDNVKSPTMFVVFDSCQCYPYYLIRYKDLPREIDI